MQHWEEETMRSGSVTWIYNPLSQQEDRIDERLVEAVDTLEIPANNNAIERIIFGVDSGYSS